MGAIGRELGPSRILRQVDWVVGGQHLDLLVAVLGWWLVGGLYLDGWAHVHQPSLETFFTPWHFALYSGLVVTWGVIILAAVLNRLRGASWGKAVPVGYELSVLGGGLFLIGGGLDLLWHTLFGIENDTAALLSPTHLLLATSGVLVLAGPLRRADIGERSALGGWAALAPAILSLGAILAVLAFFTAFAHPFVDPWAAADVRAREVTGEIFAMSADGTAQTRLTVDSGREHSGPVWSPDGRRIAFAAGADWTSMQLFVANADGTEPQMVSDGVGYNWQPTWSPDGSSLAFSARRGVAGQGFGQEDIWLVHADGTGLARLTGDEGRHLYPSWSPDGRQIAYTLVRGGAWRIYLMDVDGRNQRQVRGDGEEVWYPRWSPDGTRIAYITGKGFGHNQIAVMRPDGSGVVPLTDERQDNRFPAWSRDGRRIAFTSNRDGDWEVYVMNADGGAQSNLSRSPGSDEGDAISWSPDGQRIAYSSQGRPALQSFLTVNAGLASILLQSGLLMGVVLLAVRRWRLHPGSLTLLVACSGAALAYIHDQSRFIPVALAAGLVADLLYWRLRPSPERRRAFRAFAFLVPVVLYSLYYGALQMTSGVDWVIHLWLGSIVMAGLTGLLLSFLLVPGARESRLES